MAKEKKSITGLQVGTSSLVLIFVVLSLVVFAILSLLSSLSDSKLTEKNKASVEAYYTADCLAEEKVAEIDKEIKKALETTASEAEFVASLEGTLGNMFDEDSKEVAFGVPVGEKLMLFVELEVLYNNSSSERYFITRWQEENISDYEIDDSMPVWTGDF